MTIGCLKGKKDTILRKTINDARPIAIARVMCS